MERAEAGFRAVGIREKAGRPFISPLPRRGILACRSPSGASRRWARNHGRRGGMVQLSRQHSPETWDIYERLDRSLDPSGPDSLFDLAGAHLKSGADRSRPTAA